MSLCSRCGIDKPTYEFYVDRGRLTARCKSCRITVQSMTAAEREADIAERDDRDEALAVAYDAGAWRDYPWPGEWDAAESWRPIPSYLGLYEASDKGRVRSLWFENGKGRRRRQVPHVLRPYTNTLGYQSVTLVVAGFHNTEHIHRLVLLSFRGQPADGHIGGHRDGNPSNNALSNLDWITFIENEADKRRHGRTLTGSKNHQAKLTESAVREMRELYARGDVSTAALAKRFGISDAVASKVLTGQSWRHVAGVIA